MLITTWFRIRIARLAIWTCWASETPLQESILGVFREVCGMPMDDGITFEAVNLRIERIREELEYGGLRLRTVASLSRCSNQGGD